MSLTVTIDADPLRKLTESFSKLGGDLPGTIDTAIRMTALDGQRHIVEKTPRKIGNLARGFRVQRVNEFFWFIQNIVKYFPFVEEDTKPHEIRPKNGKALAFPWQATYGARTGGTLRFRRSGALTETSARSAGNLAMGVFAHVHHPGTTGQHMMGSSKDYIQEKLNYWIKIGINNLFEKIKV